MEQAKPGDFVAGALPPGVPVVLPVQCVQVRPDKMWILPEGDINDEPTFALICTMPGIPQKLVVQISLNMFNQGLGDLGKLSFNLDPKAPPIGETNETVNSDNSANA